MSQRVFNSVDAFRAEGARLHPGEDQMHWSFVCPKCGVKHIVWDWHQKGFKPSGYARKCLDCGYENAGNLPILVKNADTGVTDSTFEFSKFTVVAARPKGGLGLF